MTEGQQTGATRHAEGVREGSYRDFLQTALFVDDFALAPKVEGVSEVIEPYFAGPATNTERSVDVETTPHAAAELVDDTQDVTRTEELVEGLADKGVTCAVLAPTGLEAEDLGRIKRLARRTDLLILDWNLGDGATSGRLISEIIREDYKYGGRLRLVVVYTAEDHVADLTTELAALLHAQPAIEGVAHDDKTVHGDHFRVSFIRKARPGGASVGVDPGVSTSELAEQVFEQFDHLVGEGLLQRLALRALSEVRDHAQHLLARFDSALDPAFLGHRAMTSHRDAVLFSLELLGTELASLVRSSDISEMLSSEMVSLRVQELLQGKNQTRLWKIDKGAWGQPVDVERVRQFFETPNRDTRSGCGARSDEPSVSSLLIDRGDADPAAVEPDVFWVESEFALLSSLVRTARHEPSKTASPTLEFGVVVRASDGRYLMCIQPACDSVRVKADKAKPFYFLSLDPAGTDFSFDVMVWDGAAIPLVSGSIASIDEVKFIGDAASEVVKSTAVDDFLQFTALDGTKLRWVGTVRDARARRILQKLINKLTRVGLDEPYFMVRSAPE